MRFELMDCERVLMEEIARKETTRDTLAVTYGLAIRSSERDRVEWGKVNRAIMERWSVSALEYIKRKAWAGPPKEPPGGE